MKMTNRFQEATVCLMFVVIMLLFSNNVCSSELAYTIQTGSFVSEKDASKQFDRVLKELHAEELDGLRIEKIGKYYSLRLGKFNDRALADNLFTKVKNKFASAIIMRGYIKKERVIRSYSTLLPYKQDEVEEKISFNDTFPTGLVYTIQTGSFTSEKTAQKQFGLIMEKLHVSDFDYVRIEKIGKHYCLRIGNFEKRELADDTYKAVRAKFPAAVIMDAYIKENRIVKLQRNGSMASGKVLQENPAQKQVSVNNDSNEQGRADAKSATKEDTVPDLFFKGKKPEINENHQRKIRPNNERKGDMYVDEKQYFRALEEYRQARYKRPILRRKMAVLYYRMGFVDESIAEMETVVELSPKISADRMMLGTLYLATGKGTKAKEQFIEALEINPGETYAYCYLAELFLKEKEYDMAWLSVKMARKLGYKGEGFVDRLRTISNEPAANLWDITEDGLSLRLILVNTYKQASEILERIKQGELFESIAGNESVGPGRNAGGFIGQLSPSEVVSEIFTAMHNEDAFSEPVIVKSRNGYHVVQKVLSFDINKWKAILADNGKMDLLTANELKREQNFAASIKK